MLPRFISLVLNSTLPSDASKEHSRLRRTSVTHAGLKGAIYVAIVGKQIRTSPKHKPDIRDRTLNASDVAPGYRTIDLKAI